MGPDLVLGHVATSETLATNDGPADVVQGGGPDAPGDADDPNDTVLGAAPSPGDDSVLPLTGTTVSLLLSLAFALIAAGAWVLALQRRPKGRAGR